MQGSGVAEQRDNFTANLESNINSPLVLVLVLVSYYGCSHHQKDAHHEESVYPGSFLTSEFLKIVAVKTPDQKPDSKIFNEEMTERQYDKC